METDTKEETRVADSSENFDFMEQDDQNGMDEDEIMENELSDNDQLRQFDVLDDLDAHADHNETDNDSDSCSDVSLGSNVPDEEIEAMLEASRCSKSYKFLKNI